jgi:hypothetical protein
MSAFLVCLLAAVALVLLFRGNRLERQVADLERDQESLLNELHGTRREARAWQQVAETRSDPAAFWDFIRKGGGL